MSLEFWDKVKDTDKKFTKNVSYGRSFTSINPQWQIREATKHWGAYGGKWGLKNTSLTHLEGVTKGTMYLYKAVFYSPLGEFEIMNSIFAVNDKGRVDDEFAKKVETDTLTKAMSKVGFSANIFMGLWEDARYVEQEALKFKIADNNEMASKEELAELWKKVDAKKLKPTEDQKKELTYGVTKGRARQLYQNIINKVL